MRKLVGFLSGALVLSILQVGPCLLVEAQDINYTAYEIGSPTLQDVWVDPVSGNDANSGSDRTTALRTLTEAWNRTPQGVTFSSTGYRIQLVAGDYPRDSVPVYFESRWGTQQYPLIIQAADGRGTANLHGDMNVYNTRYLYLIDFDIIPVPAGDAFHCERCDHVLMRGMELDGGAGHEAHETIKMNQSQYIYIEDSNVHSTYENAVDFVSVQYGHIRRNKLHDGDDWCIYLKGGSAYFIVEGNEIYNCGTGGFSVGQGTGFEYMQTPWLHYEGYEVKFVNNIVHNTQGAGFGVNGGYNVLFAHNTLYRVGSRSHVIEVVHGRRSCDGDSATCSLNNTAGGWGPRDGGVGDYPIPNRNVYIFNNIVYNPAGFQSAWTHFFIQGPESSPAGSNIPDPSLVDTNLRVRGNLIYNGPSDLPVGAEGGDAGCQPSNPTCNGSQLVAENSINVLTPQLENPEGLDFRPISGSNVYGVTAYAIPSFSGGDRESTPEAPQGNLSNAVPSDYSGSARIGSAVVGAYTGTSIARTAGDDYLQWNSFIGMLNILELSNPNSDNSGATITIWNSQGNAVAQTTVTLAPNAQRDIILNDLAGFVSDAYGLVSLNYTGGHLRGRMSFYRLDIHANDEYDFAYATAIIPPIYGSSYVNYNTNYPAGSIDELNYQTSNWLAIVNADPSQTLNVSVYRYNSEGTSQGSERRSISPFGRVDIAPNVAGGDKIGLVRLVPENSGIPYFAYNIRYGSGESLSDYKFAFPLVAQIGGPSEVYLPVSTGGNAVNYVEVSNLSTRELTAQALIYDGGGNQLGEAIALRLAPYAQVHLPAGLRLADGASGMMRIIASENISAYSMYYFYDASAHLVAMYGVGQWSSSMCMNTTGSYNLFLGMYNWLKLFNPTDIYQNGTLRVTSSSGGVMTRTVSLPPHGATDLGLHQYSEFGTAPNSYGQLTLSDGTICAEILRIKPTSSGAFDFVFPTTME